MTAMTRSDAAASPADAAQMRRVATGILGALLGVYLLTFTMPAPPVWVALVRAMAEAGMIGGLADWFAVEALFRRPMGLPIPHTALLPTNQKRAARNIARFIDEYFLSPAQLIAKVREIDPTRRLLNWLQVPDNARAVGTELAWTVQLLAKKPLADGLPPRARDLVMDLLAETTKSGTFDARVSELLRHALDTDVLDEVLARVRQAIDDNRPAIVQLVQERSRWWIASGVDRQVANLLVDGVLSVLDDLSDADKPMRQGFTQAVGQIVERFEQDGLISRYLSETLTDPEARANVADRLDAVLAEILEVIESQVGENPAAVADAAAEAISTVAQNIATDDATLDALNLRLEGALTSLIDEARPMIRDYIFETISRWDSAELVARLEAEVGRDLQFIRINGAVLGAALGGVFFFLSHFVLGG